MRKKLAWTTNLLNIGVLTMLATKGCSPVHGAIACAVAVLTILVAVIPGALTTGIVYNDDLDGQWWNEYIDSEGELHYGR